MSGQDAPDGAYQQASIPAARAPITSAAGVSPTHSRSEGGKRSALQAAWKKRASGFATPSSSEIRTAEKQLAMPERESLPRCTTEMPLVTRQRSARRERARTTERAWGRK